MAFTVERIFPTDQDVGSLDDQGGLYTEDNVRDWMKWRGMNFVPSGLTVTAGSGLNATVAAGEAIIDGFRVNLTGSESITLTDNAVNRVYLQLAEVGGDINTAQIALQTGTTIPSNAICLAEVRTKSAAITDVWRRAPTNPVVWLVQFDGTKTAPSTSNLVLGFRPYKASGISGGDSSGWDESGKTSFIAEAVSCSIQNYGILVGSASGWIEIVGRSPV